MRRLLRAVFAAALVVLAIASRADAHPLTRGTLDVTLRPDGADVRARISREELQVTDMLTATPGTAGAASPADALAAACERHAAYVASRLRVSAGGEELVARVVRVIPEAAGNDRIGAHGSDADAVYEFEFRTSGKSLPPDAALEIRSTVLTDVTFAPGTSWEATYVVNVRRDAGAVGEGLLLSTEQTVVVERAWDAVRAAEGASTGATLLAYVNDGIHHILTGPDHLLFVCSLVLAARGLWDLVKVVTSFTVAHTLTLTLATLGWARLPSAVVEPVIAASIVYVAVENVFLPARGSDRRRLLVAFGFGLFHGLGYAGGLVAAMQGLPGGFVAGAIAAFSVGVEIGHQVVVLPVFGLLVLLRRTRAEPDAQERVLSATRRFGSAAIAAGGVFYLVAALRSSFGA